MSIEKRPTTIPIGYAGEYNARSIGLYIGDLQAMCTDGHPTVFARLPKSGDWYPAANTTVEGDRLTWHFTAYDASVYGAGMAYIAIIDQEGEVKATSENIMTQISGAGRGLQDRPDPFESWIDHLVATGTEYAETAAAAAAYAGEKADAAQEAKKAAEQARDTAQNHAENAAEYERAANVAAANAGDSKEAAAKSAEDAKKSADMAASAKGEAEKAAADANTAQKAAEAAQDAAKGEADNAKAKAKEASQSAREAAQSAAKAAESEANAAASVNTVRELEKEAAETIEDAKAEAVGAIEEKTNEQLERIPEVTALSGDVAAIKSDIATLAETGEIVSTKYLDFEKNQISATGSVTQSSYTGYLFTNDFAYGDKIYFDDTVYKINVYYEKNGAKTGYTAWITESPVTLDAYAFDRIGINVRKGNSTVSLGENDLHKSVYIDSSTGNLATKKYVDDAINSIPVEHDAGVKVLYPNQFESRLKPAIYKTGARYRVDFAPDEHKIKSTTECYVATNGNDANDGTQDRPYATITKAFASGAVTIYLNAGTYTVGTHFKARETIPAVNMIAIGDVIIDSGDVDTGWPMMAKSTSYFEGIEFCGGRFAFYADLAEDETVCLFRCKFRDNAWLSGNCVSVYGGNAWIVECEAYGAGLDGFNYHANGDVKCCAVEIDCISHDNGRNETNNSCNGSTVHDGCSIVRVNGEYYNCHGGVIADKGLDDGVPSYSCNFGVYSHDSTIHMSAYPHFNAAYWAMTNTKMWLFDCMASGCDYEISAFDGGIVYASNLMSENSFAPVDYATGGTIVRR